MATEFGYMGKILKVDLSSGSMCEVPTFDYTDRFIGGTGIATKIYWDEIPPQSNSLDPENRLIFMTGPLCGHPGLAASRVEMCTKLPLTEQGAIYHGTLSGSWPPFLKFTGYDGVVVSGKSDKPVYLLIQEGGAELRDASALSGKDVYETQEQLKAKLGRTTRVLATGPAGENLVRFATAAADDDSCIQGAAVFGSKKLKAVVISAQVKQLPVAKPEKLAELRDYLRGQGHGPPPWWGPLGTPFLDKRTQLCWGCVKGCHRITLKTADSLKVKIQCQPAGIYMAAKGYYQEKKDKDIVPFLATRLCNTVGLETRALGATISWLMSGYKTGILTEANTGLPLSKYGSWEFFETLVNKISLREGFGDALAEGLPHAIEAMGGRAKEIPVYLNERGQSMGFTPRMFNINGILHATIPFARSVLSEVSDPVARWQRWLKGEKDYYMSYDRLHELGRRWWGSELTYDFSTYKGKAVAAKRIQDRHYAMECLILCQSFYPLKYCDYTETHEGDPTIESELYSAITGNETDEEGLNRIGERVFNLERAILARDDPRGRWYDELPEWCYTVPEPPNHHLPGGLVPGKDGEVMSREGKVFDREEFAQMLEEYYELRGWDKTGLQTKQKLVELDLADIAQVLA
jgi:aldehyde:ferredoxin oxidoreductase